MLQSPSKYHHNNTLSHFLAVHNVHPTQQENSHIDPVMNSSSLDAGKSFTIAAILGLQKNSLDTRQQTEFNSVMNLSLNNNNTNQTNYHHGTPHIQTSGHNFQKFNLNNSGSECDNSLINRYLQPNNLHGGHFRHFAPQSVNVPSALQSLQQLHQHHTQQQQAQIPFQREKFKDHKKSSLKSKRVRTIFTPEQLERLEAEFERQQYMVGPERLYLAHTLQLTEAQVKVWFQNRRIKWRKHHLEITQQRLALLRQTQQPNDDAEKFDSPTRNNEIDLTQQQQSESDLSVCNDSMDGDSEQGDVL